MTNKKGVKEIIESFSRANPKLEHAFAKFPGKEVFNTTDTNHEGSVLRDLKEVEKRRKAEKHEYYTNIHTHPDKESTSREVNVLHAYVDSSGNKKNQSYTETRKPNPGSTSYTIPSRLDMANFLSNRQEKTMVIALQDKISGNISGYCVMRKTKRTPQKLLSRVKAYIDVYREKNDEGLERNMDELINKYSLNYRFVPANGYQHTGMVREGKDWPTKYGKFIRKSEALPSSGLESKIAAVIASVSLISSLMLISLSLTGSVIENDFIDSSNILGSLLFIIGLSYFFYYIRNK